MKRKSYIIKPVEDWSPIELRWPHESNLIEKRLQELFLAGVRGEY